MNVTENDELHTGLERIKSYVALLDNSPGVYRMLTEQDVVLYVGKARALRNRVTSYTRPTGHSPRILRMIAQTRRMVFLTTQTEAEALLLEQNLIKQLKPRYNILLRDDKSFPEILIETAHTAPRIGIHRGTHRMNGRYFGPFASSQAAYRTLDHLERIFMLRTCSDSDYASRTRPCLQYQIKRCSAPCTGKISIQDYQAQINEVLDFLDGKSQQLQKNLALRMETASQTLNFELAATLRDRLQNLSATQTVQNINPKTVAQADIIALERVEGLASIQIFFIRNHQNWGNAAYFPSVESDQTNAEILEAFIGQFYKKVRPPHLILLSESAENMDLLETALAIVAETKIIIKVPKRGEKLQLVSEALRNAREAAVRKQAEAASHKNNLHALARFLGLANDPKRIEVYDNSHNQGAHAIGAMIVVGEDGFLKSHYRKFDIKSQDITPGDDFAMMGEVLTRRFERLGKGEGIAPDLVLIDGGPEQIKRAHQAMQACGFDIPITGIAKGSERHAGRETFYHIDRPPMALGKHDPLLYFIQRLRDEAHRFAIGTHRKKHTAQIGKNALDQIPGIGSKRKRALLHHFGSAKAVRDAHIEDLARVAGISMAMAKLIYSHFHKSVT